MSAHVLLNLFSKLGKKIRCEAVLSSLSIFSNKFNKFNYTGVRIQDSIYHMTLISHLLANFTPKRHDFTIRKRDIFMDVNA